jgi:hypothetical protein
MHGRPGFESLTFNQLFCAAGWIGWSVHCGVCRGHNEPHKLERRVRLSAPQKISGDGVVGLHGCLKHSKSWFNPRSLDHSGQLEKNFGPNVHGYLGNSFIGKRGSNPLSRKLENSVSHNLSEVVLGNGPIGRPAAFEAVHRVGSSPTSPASHATSFDNFKACHQLQPLSRSVTVISALGRKRAERTLETLRVRVPP